MSEAGTLILARAHGRELLLEASQLQEVLPMAAVAPLPGPLPGISGVILYHGEFLPVFDWSMLGGGTPDGPPAALGILKRRLALPLEELSGTVEAGESGCQVGPPGEDPWAQVLAGSCAFGGPTLPLLDPDKLIVWLHQRRARR